jgi:hypothetical protein
MATSRYVVLWHHDVNEPHYDLMFQTYAKSDLATWRSPRWPIEEPVELVRLKDHRRFYLEYEGDLSDRRGRVDRMAGGDCELEIGEGGVWDVRLINGAPPARLRIRQIDAERWVAVPVDGLVA